MIADGLHHKTFDLGASTASPDRALLVSDQAHGTEGFYEALLRHHGRRIGTMTLSGTATLGGRGVKIRESFPMLKIPLK